MADNFTRTIPDGDNRHRLVCRDCGYVEYTNPKVVVGAVCTWEEAGRERILLCRRAIEPGVGLWTIPSGYMELNESTAEGAARETREEALADVSIEHLLGLYDIPYIGQVCVIYKATLNSPDFGPGEESQETALFAWDTIPWDDLAFPSVRWALEHYRDGGAPGTVISAKK